MSTALIVSLAFLVGFIFAYKPLKRVIRKALNSKRNKSKFTSEETKKFRQEMLEYYRKSSERYAKLDEEANAIMKEMLAKANNIIEYNRQRLDKTLDDNAQANLKKVTDQFEKTIENIKAGTASIAADAVEKILREHHKDSEQNSEIISSLSRDLNKKLH
ncbi:ATP synthase F0 subunit B [Wolbachia endosymbiont of Ctenocephalides felis wCfeT]|uniref:ATP synthase F0 subunit B n=1 Tax=Wolbachia endosymbiont of Ctenocephalides felis wCfeT TaxID=2732593 RepID=UPI0014464B5F|nr:ATP synthase F0 subunit B [Wolbachia endosymbiont of Ctenocephalides felis wCfeT]